MAVFWHSVQFEGQCSEKPLLVLFGGFSRFSKAYCGSVCWLPVQIRSLELRNSWTLLAVLELIFVAEKVSAGLIEGLGLEEIAGEGFVPFGRFI